MVKQLAVGSSQWTVEFSIFCSNKDLDGSLLSGVAFDEWVNYSTCTKVWYSSTSNILPVLQTAVKKERPDYLFVIGLYDWQYNFKPLLFCKGVKKIISVRGMLHPGALSQKGFKKNIYLRFWKLLGLHKGSGQLAVGCGQGANVFHATDEAEEQYIKAVFGEKTRVVVAANFPNVLPVQAVVQKKPGFLKLGSIALISPMKNILLVLEALGSSREAGVKSWEGVSGQSLRSNEILPVAESDIDRFAQRNSISSDQDDKTIIEYNIYGPVKDKSYWELCEALIKKLPVNVTVNYHGDLQPDKITGALAASHVFILPSKSENFGHSLYEALSAGRPVITSNNTPWINLEEAKAGMNVSVNDTNELRKAIGFFAAMDQGALEEWSKRARTYAEDAIDMNAIRIQYEEMFGQLAN